MNNSIRIESAAQAAAIIRAELPKVQKEERVFVLPLDANGKMLAKPILVSVGHQDGTTTIDAGAIFRAALKSGAEEIIVAHNHPSGDPTPSKADYDATVRLNDGANLVGLELIDHLIIIFDNIFCRLVFICGILFDLILPECINIRRHIIACHF